MVNAPLAPAQNGVPLAVGGTVYPASDQVKVGISSSGTVAPTSYVQVAAAPDGTWAAIVTPNFSGNAYIWAQQYTRTQVLISLRWSLDKGKTFGNKVYQPVGAQGDFLSVPSWRRLGLGRDVVFELEWSFNGSSALNGAFLDFAVMKT
jgi:hypothetical protein